MSREVFILILLFVSFSAWGAKVTRRFFLVQGGAVLIPEIKIPLVELAPAVRNPSAIREHVKNIIRANRSKFVTTAARVQVVKAAKDALEIFETCASHLETEPLLLIETEIPVSDI